MGRIKGVGRIWLQAVVDAYESFAFAKFYTSKLPETAVDVLYDRALPFMILRDQGGKHPHGQWPRILRPTDDPPLSDPPHGQYHR